MKKRVNFEWLAGGEEEGEWETIAQSERHRWLRLFDRVSKRAWITLAALVFTALMVYWGLLVLPV